MISIKPPRIINSKTLGIFSAHVTTLLPRVKEIREAYCDYLRTGGSPSILAPIAVTPAEKAALLSLYKSTYKKKVDDKYKLNWINELRDCDDYPYCPMCGNVGWSALEHYLPESHYPEFAFFSYNLIPTCSSCNGKRLNHANAPATILPLLHPYVDSAFLTQPIVVVEILGKVKPTGLSFEMPSFKLMPAIQATNPVYSRLGNHITKCVSSAQLKRWSKYLWREWRDKATEHTSTVSLQNRLGQALKRQVKLGGHNSWSAAFLRGLHGNMPALQWMILNPIYDPEYDCTEK